MISERSHWVQLQWLLRGPNAVFAFSFLRGPGVSRGYGLVARMAEKWIPLGCGDQKPNLSPCPDGSDPQKGEQPPNRTGRLHHLLSLFLPLSLNPEQVYLCLPPPLPPSLVHLPFQHKGNRTPKPFNLLLTV